MIKKNLMDFFFCKILINLLFCCCTSVVWDRNHDYGNDADVRLFDREKSSDFSEDLSHSPDATKELGEGNDEPVEICSKVCRDVCEPISK